MIQIYKHENNGAFSILTTAATEEHFIRMLLTVLPEVYFELHGDNEFTADCINRLAFNIMSYLRETDNFDQDYIISGEDNLCDGCKLVAQIPKKENQITSKTISAMPVYTDGTCSNFTEVKVLKENLL